MNTREMIAKNAATFFRDGDVVNLGVGIPTLAAKYVPEGVRVFLHAENGAVGVDTSLKDPWDWSSREAIVSWMRTHGSDAKDNYREYHRDLIDASSDFVTLHPGAACFDTLMSFAIARGGRLSLTVLGALEVDEDCSFANWKIPGKKLNGMGGGMDIASGARKVIIAMEHCTKDGSPKIVRKCSLPLTAEQRVSAIVTDLCVMECRPGNLRVTALAPGVTKDEIVAKTGALITFADHPGTMLS